LDPGIPHFNEGKGKEEEGMTLGSEGEGRIGVIWMKDLDEPVPQLLYRDCPLVVHLPKV
jgi:hypothetical protein